MRRWIRPLAQHIRAQPADQSAIAMPAFELAIPCPA